jgi:hypothetical protein
VVHVEAQDLAEQLQLVLRAIARIVARTAVAHADVEKPVGTEPQRTAVVVLERLRDHEQDAGGRRVRALRIRADAVFRDDCGAVRASRVVDEQPAIGAIRRVKCDTEQAPLAAARHERRKVEERCAAARAAFEDPYDAALLRHEQAAAVIAGVDDVDRRAEAAGDQLRRHGVRRQRHGGDHGEQISGQLPGSGCEEVRLRNRGEHRLS